jgi:DNA-binding NarL/FixJ family response regulator
MMHKFTHTVLVVDDAPDSLSLINATLEQAGVDTLIAMEGKQALTIARKIRPDMILLDAMMPHMDGFETCRRLKAEPQLMSIPVIFMTGLTDTESILKGLEAGCVDYLVKPVNPSELLARMRVHLKNAQLTDSARQALDCIGQNIFAVDYRGHILWATPQTYALFAKARAGSEWLQTTLAPQLENWLAHAPTAGQVFSFDCDTSPLELTLLEMRSSGEYLMKASTSEKIPGEERLQQALNLTTRESEVLFWLANGKTNKDISQILGMGVRTVNKHLEQIFPKLGVENRTSAAGIAIRILN